MQKKNFPIGKSDFRDVITNQYIFIDKSLFVKEIMEDGAEVVLITRPRRFGKTMNMSMLRRFLEQDGDKSLFDGLNVSKDQEFCKSHQNKYPVIFLSFKDIKFNSFDKAFSEIQKIFSELYEQHLYLLDDDTLSAPQKDVFDNIRYKKINNTSDLTSALLDLTKYLHKKHGVPPVLLLDEYDTPIHSAYSHKYYDSMVEIMRAILGSALKDNPHLGKAVMTGITRVAKESMFSGLNHIEVYTFLNRRYGQYFGFTEEEVVSLLPSNMSLEEVSRWYNGYKIGEYQIYNPWSIINCFKQEELGTYWLNTSDNALVYSLIGRGNLKLKLQFELLLEGKQPEQAIQEDLTFNYLDNNNDAIWTLLLHAGYLNVISKKLDNRGHYRAKIEIPNQEIMCIYNDLVSGWFVISGIDDYQDFLQSLLDQDIRAFRDHIAEYMTTCCSYFDFSSSTPEHVFHVFMLGLLIGFRDRFEVTSNRESGFGRYDVILSPKETQDHGIILEFKTCKTPEVLESTAKEALAQIESKKYDAEFKTKNTLKIGLAFCGKQVVAACTTGNDITIYTHED